MEVGAAKFEPTTFMGVEGNFIGKERESPSLSSSRTEEELCLPEKQKGIFIDAPFVPAMQVLELEEYS